ncbi:MAG: esterase-like activity of phytase family protein [Alphaproteobacteria bacterium]|nr:esterase-like activity of phytase family protein [Alphaproteobacteria bacterium]
MPGLGRRRRAAHRAALAGAALALLALLPGAPLPAPARAEPLAVTARPVPLNPDAPHQDRLGPLLWRGGVQLRAEDTRFGGLSGLAFAGGGGRIAAISDRGFWLTGRLVRDRAGHLTGLDGVEMGRLRGPDGRALPSNHVRDAESLARLPDGDWLVGFERVNRILRYPGARGGLAGIPVAMEAPAELAGAPANFGLESLAVLADGRLLALAEGQDHPAGGLMAWLGHGLATRTALPLPLPLPPPLPPPRPGSAIAAPVRAAPGASPEAAAPWRAFAYTPGFWFQPTDAASLPDGGALVLERRFTLLTGLQARLALLPAAALAQPADRRSPIEIARFAAPLTLDNFEGLAVEPLPGGRLRILIVSDDNYRRSLQRTLLLMFETEGPLGP